jgi:hypothetical protein
MQMHRRQWICTVGCNRNFADKGLLQTHLQGRHPEMFDSLQLPVLLDICERPSNMDTETECPLCFDILSLGALYSHLAAHLEELALFLLPLNPNDSPDDGNSDSAKLVLQNETQQDFDNLSSLSSYSVADATEPHAQDPQTFELLLKQHELAPDVDKDETDPFGHHLNSATKLSRETKPLYKKVDVFLITWEENDDIKEEIEEEVGALTKLFGELNYHVTPFAIPNIDSQNELQFEVLNFLRAHMKDPPRETLFIVYYTGHSSTRDNACYWHPTAGAASGINRRDPTSKQTGPTVEWSKTQENFEHVNKQDVLFILDCCYAGSPAMHKGSGQSTKELLAAYGSEEETEAGEGSFTLRFVECMRRMVQTEKVFWTSRLYEELITVSQSPLCLHISLNRSMSSILLSSLETSNPPS